MVRSAPCSCPVVTSALREPLSKHLSETIDPRTIVRTLGPLEEDNETSMQTSPVGLLDTIDTFIDRLAPVYREVSLSPRFQKQSRRLKPHKFGTDIDFGKVRLNLARPVMACARTASRSDDRSGLWVEQGLIKL